MKCFNCGNIVKKDVNFCPNCGASLTNYEKNIKEETKNEEKVDNEIKNKDYKTKKTDILGVASFILGLCGLWFSSFVISVLAIVFSCVSLIEFDEVNNKNRGFAIAGLALGNVAMVVSFVQAAIENLNVIINLIIN